MRILAIDTAFSDGRIALVEEGKIVAEDLLEAGHLESRTFTSIVKLGVPPNLDGIDLIALAAGPGSFTGLKIGAMVAKSLSFLQGKPLKGVGTLPWLAASSGGGVVLPYFKSHGKKYYWGLYDAVPQDKPATLPKMILKPAASDVQAIVDSISVAGYWEIVNTVTVKNPEINPGFPWGGMHVELDLTRLASLAELQLTAEGPDDPITFTPIYVSRSQAEEKLEKKNQ